jgi:transcriptional regulator with XRE-family HTH domain
MSKKEGTAFPIREYGPLLLIFLFRPLGTVTVLLAPVNRITSPIYFKNGFRSKGDCCMDQVALGKRIKAARERAGMTQEDLAAAVEYSVDHMSVVERGVKAPKLDKLVTIANVLKVGTDELLQDNLDAATLLHATELSERLKALSPEGQRKVMNVLDTLVDELR